MFCCNRNKGFTLNHQFDKVKSRIESKESVVLEQPTLVTCPSRQVSVVSNAVRSSCASTVVSGHEGSNSNQTDQLRRGGMRGQTVDTNVKIPRHSKSSSVAEAIGNALMNNEFLRWVIPKQSLDQIVSAMEPRDVQADEVIITQGEVGNEFFVSETGNYEIHVDGEVVATINDQRVFGELAVLHKNPRAATIKALTDGRIWALEGTIYQAILINSAINEQEQRLRFLEKVPMVQEASTDKLKQIATLMREVFYATKSVIIKQGDKGDRFFVIKAGRVKVHVENVGVVNELSEGQYFGEKALIQTDVRQATCTAEPPGVTCLELSRQDFITYLGDLKDFLNKKPQEGPVVKEEKTEEEREQEYPPLKDITSLKTIGVGGFGRVVLTKDVKGRIYALKKISKADNTSTEQREHLKNEKKVQSECRSPFIVRLFRTYQDSRYLYLLMEACLGGDLFTLMQRQKGHCFNEENARFIAGCILEAIIYLHRQNIIYRDLKPENMLVDADGYIKLTDFGFAKVVQANTYTFSGTPEYVAPEVIYNSGHNRAVDYWAYGIFVYELLVGKTPFKTNDASYMKTYGLILKGIENIQIPTRVSKPAANLIKKLCRLTPHERLGYQKRGPAEIRDHKWFHDMKWADLMERRIVSKFKPTLSSAEDTQYFDDFGDNHPDPPIVDTIWEDF